MAAITGEKERLSLPRCFLPLNCYPEQLMHGECSGVIACGEDRQSKKKDYLMLRARETCDGSFNGMLFGAVMTFLDIFQHLLINFIPKNE